MILLLTGRGISVSIVTISFLIAKPTPVSLLSPLGLPLRKKEYLRLPDSENLVSHRPGGNVDVVFGKLHCY